MGTKSVISKFLSDVIGARPGVCPGSGKLLGLASRSARRRRPNSSQLHSLVYHETLAWDISLRCAYHQMAILMGAFTFAAGAFYTGLWRIDAPLVAIPGLVRASGPRYSGYPDPCMRYLLPLWWVLLVVAPVSRPEANHPTSCLPSPAHLVPPSRFFLHRNALALQALLLSSRP